MDTTQPREIDRWLGSYSGDHRVLLDLLRPSFLGVGASHPRFQRGRAGLASIPEP